MVAIAPGWHNGTPGLIYTSQSTPAPLLTSTLSGGNAVLSWIVPSMDFALQQSSDLSTTHWTDVPTAPTLDLTNLQNQMSVSLVVSNRFYRLKH